MNLLTEYKDDLQYLSDYVELEEIDDTFRFKIFFVDKFHNIKVANFQTTRSWLQARYKEETVDINSAKKDLQMLLAFSNFIKSKIQ